MTIVLPMVWSIVRKHRQNQITAIRDNLPSRFQVGPKVELCGVMTVSRVQHEVGACGLNVPIHTASNCLAL